MGVKYKAVAAGFLTDHPAKSLTEAEIKEAGLDKDVMLATGLYSDVDDSALDTNADPTPGDNAGEPDAVLAWEAENEALRQAEAERKSKARALVLELFGTQPSPSPSPSLLNAQTETPPPVSVPTVAVTPETGPETEPEPEPDVPTVTAPVMVVANPNVAQATNPTVSTGENEV